jgi:integrase
MVGELADQVGVRTANICRTVLYSALKQAIRWQLVMVNPVEAVDPLKETSREMTLWAPHEVVRFLEVAASHRLYALFYLVILTGLRRGEALGLCWQDVHGDNLMVRRSLTLVDGKPVLSPPKTAKGIRRVALSSDALSVLDEHRARQQALREFVGEAWGGSRWHDFDLVFTSELGTAIHPRNLERSWYVLQEKAGVPRVRLHDLRHLNVSLRRKQGQDAKLIADQVGHTNPAFTMRLYTHLFDDDRRGAALSMTDLLPARASSEPN